MELKITDEMVERNRINDAQEFQDAEKLKEHAKLQLQEFYNARKQKLENLPKFDPIGSAESNNPDISLSNVLKYIDLKKDHDESRSRMKKIFFESRKETA